ncbi:ATP-binding cassette domain-containing protein [Streptomyces rimosus]|uniref:ATP-binding cassette domain-containing protein n=1 Tax=Streptomyces rimosus TaxID=1927 RepID=UPI00067CF81B|nr:ATP-binding cassette domain-containing protein [Streptomyces rimosus]
MIVCKGLTKDYDSRRVVESVSFEVPAGSVTALVGRNGSGKSTTVRMLLGLTTPTTGTALIDGVPYRDIPSPARVVGAAITDVPGHPSLTVRAQLRLVARSLAAPATAVDDILGRVDLAGASSRKIGWACAR